MGGPYKYLNGLEFTYYSAHADWYKYYGFNKIDTGNTGKQIIIDALANDGIGWIASWTPTYTDSSGNYSSVGWCQKSHSSACSHGTGV